MYIPNLGSFCAYFNENITIVAEITLYLVEMYCTAIQSCVEVTLIVNSCQLDGTGN